MTTRTERLTLPDGELQAHVALPQSGSGPGMLLIHEIFGVNDYVRDCAQRLTEAGYVVLAPDLFWRTQPGLELAHDEEGLQKGMAAVGELDFEAAVGDCIATLGILRELPECTGAAGIIGFCLGGSLAWLVAVNDDPDVAVCYYGSAIPDALGGASAVTCPVLMHWGGADQFIPRAGIDAVAAMADEHEHIECHVHEGAGHAFDNHLAAQFHQPEARGAAWQTTAEFLARTLPPG